jgi:hypothetical protein
MVGTRAVGVAAALALLALVPATPASAAEKRVFEPARTSTKSVTFHVRGVNARRVMRASLVRNGQIRRRIGRDRARRVARRGVLRVPVRRARGERKMARIVSHASARRSPLWVRRIARRSVRLKVVTDTTAPETRIASGPPATTDSHEAGFRFGADEKRSTFQCRMDSFDWRACTSPITYTEVPDGEHTFSVRARDRFGNVDATPATMAWVVGAAVAEPSEPSEPSEPASVPEPTPELVAVGDTLLFDDFTGADGVITNHYAFWHGDDDASAFRDEIWEMESGCALRRDNTLWTGVPTSNIPNRDCSNGSGSEVFRLWTKRSFQNVSVSLMLRNNGYVSGAVGERSWDGIKVWLRRQGGTGPVRLYTAEVNRRQGNVIIQKKCGDADYHIIGQGWPEGSAASIGSWEKVGGSVTNLPDGSVKITVMRHGRTVLEAIDTGIGCAPITTGGRVGIRGDYTNFNADDFLVVPAV